MPIFAHTEAVDVAVRSVQTAGGQLPVRLLAVSYSLPPDVPFERLVYDVGREFLGATPANATPTLDSHGVYMRSMTRGQRTESVAFFAGENLFVYIFGGTVEAPTEEIAKKLYEANCEIRTCERPGIY
ncbi:MAG: hypothetical protein M3323_00580 [Actinomycetota bacterium]|nr:hypothetical protein [Actinomycetota bacterium]